MVMVMVMVYFSLAQVTYKVYYQYKSLFAAAIGNLPFFKRKGRCLGTQIGKIVNKQFN